MILQVPPCVRHVRRESLLLPRGHRNAPNAPLGELPLPLVVVAATNVPPGNFRQLREQNARIVSPASLAAKRPTQSVRLALPGSMWKERALLNALSVIKVLRLL